MMKELSSMSEVKDMLTTARSILGYDILDIMLNGPEDKLAQTKFCQPAMYIAGLAAMEKLKQENSDVVERCQAVAGLSLGEYTALTVAGVFSFEVGLKLVKARGEAMEHETTKPDAPKQGMLSVAGLSEDVVNGICEELATGGKVVQIANYLFPNGFSCAGNYESILELEQRVTKAGALQAKLLKTSGAFHTPIMALAREKLLLALEEARPSMQPPRCKVYMNVTAKTIDERTPIDEIITMLGNQLTSAVRWDASMQNAIKDGIEEFYECGPNKQLKAMMKRIDKDFANKTQNVLA
jgi:[acyl-carrier-protein] S-malonyltransferase